MKKKLPSRTIVEHPAHPQCVLKPKIVRTVLPLDLQCWMDRTLLGLSRSLAPQTVISLDRLTRSIVTQPRHPGVLALKLLSNPNFAFSVLKLDDPLLSDVPTRLFFLSRRPGSA